MKVDLIRVAVVLAYAAGLAAVGVLNPSAPTRRGADYPPHVPAQ